MTSKLFELVAGRTGHFQMESGYHSELWFELNRLFAQPEQLRPYLSDLGRRLAAHRIEAVCGPMTGGAKLAEAIAAELGVAYFFTERSETSRATGLFPVRYSLPSETREKIRGKRVAIVDDAISAGSALRGTHADLLAWGAQPVVCGALFVFGEPAQRFATQNGLGLEALCQRPFAMWQPAECPLCRAGVALTKVSEG